MPLSSFVLARQVITLGSPQTDRDCLATYEPSHQKCDIRMNAFAFNTARASAQVLIEPRSPTTAFRGTTASEFVLTHGCQNPLPLVAPDLSGNFYITVTFTWLTKPSTESPNPEAAVVPALVSIFDSEVTSLECVTTRPLGYVLPSSSHTLLIEQKTVETTVLQSQISRID